MEKEFTLFISTCKCGHRYLGASSRKKMVGKSYFGSGAEWLEHLKNCEVVNWEELHTTHNYDSHCQKAEELSDHYDVVKNFYNIQKEKGVPLNNGHIGVGNWSKEEKKLWYSQNTDETPDQKDALYWTGEEKQKDEEYDLMETLANIDLVEKLLDMITSRQKYVLKCRFGIGCKPLTVAEVAEKVINLSTGERGVARETVRRIEATAMRRIRNKFDNAACFLV
jgi:DNA-directed RNA polymerase specialized sigma subunit